MTDRCQYCQLLSTIRGLLTFLLVAISHAVSAAGPTPKPAMAPYTLGVFPHLSSGQIEKLFAPLAAHLSRQLGRPVRLRTKPNFNDFTSELSRQAYDIAFVQPFDYVVAHDKYGYEPLARRTGALAAILVVLPNSPLHSLGDLKGKTIGLPPSVAAVSYLTRMALSDAGMNIEKDVILEYFKAHDACLNQLMLHKVDVCGSAEHPIRFFENKWNLKFRTLTTTRTLPPALFMAHRRIPSEDREAIKRAILSWQKTKKGRDLLQGNGFTLFQSTNDSEYEVMRKYATK